MSAAAIGACCWAASGAERKKAAGPRARSNGLNMVLLKERRLGWQAIRARRPDALNPGFRDQSVRLLHMHRLDHSAFVSLGSAGRRFDQAVCRVELGSARAEHPVHRLDLAWVN